MELSISKCKRCILLQTPYSHCHEFIALADPKLSVVMSYRASNSESQVFMYIVDYVDS